MAFRCSRFYHFVMPVVVWGSLLSLLLLGVLGCTEKRAMHEEVLVQVGEHVLLRRDLPVDLYQGKSSQDSATEVKHYLETWVRSTLLYLHAEKEMGKDNPKVERQVADFRRSLYTQSFESEYVLEHLDTTVLESEMERFYEENQPLFALKRPLVRVLLLSIPEASQHLAEVKRLYTLPLNDENMQRLSSLSMKAGIQFLFTPETWQSLTSLAKYLPADLTLAVDNRRVRHAEFSIDGLVYFLAFQEWKAVGDIAPFKSVKNEVRSIILNRREVTLVRELEERIANEGRAQVKWAEH